MVNMHAQQMVLEEESKCFLFAVINSCTANRNLPMMESNLTKHGELFSWVSSGGRIHKQKFRPAHFRSESAEKPAKRAEC